MGPYRWVIFQVASDWETKEVEKKVMAQEEIIHEYFKLHKEYGEGLSVYIRAEIKTDPATGEANFEWPE